MKVRDIHVFKLASMNAYWKNDYLYVPYEAGYKKVSCSWMEFVTLMTDSPYLDELLKRPYELVSRVPKSAWSTVVNEQNVIVLYRVNSSNVDLVGYDPINMKLYIKFLKSETFYEYSNVTPDMWEMMQNVDSKGSWTHWWIKINEDQYPFTKLTNLKYIISTTPLPNQGTPHPRGYLAFSKQPVGLLFTK